MSGAPWSVKGIDPKAREVAKDLARRSGMTLGEWLNHVILDDDGSEDGSDDQLAGLRAAPRDAAPPARLRLVSSLPQGRGEDLSRVAYALDRLTDRIEASETRTGLAITGVEHSVRQAVARIDAAERESHAAAAAAEAAQAEQALLAERLKRMEGEAAGPRSPEALRVLDQSVARLAHNVQDYETRGRELLADMGRRLAEAESRTAEALEALRLSLAALESRMRQGEAGVDPRFEALAASLTRKVEDARAEVARTLAATPDGRVDRRLDELTARIEIAERRSTEAVDRMGREVLGMAEILNRRVQDSETRSAQAIARVGEEMGRIASVVEQRMARAEQAQAEALEKLGADIGRMTERMLLSERRAAQAIDDVGDQVSRVTERIEQRYARASEDLVQRIRQSEALLGGARQDDDPTAEAEPAPQADSAPRAWADVAPEPEPEIAPQPAVEPEREEPPALAAFGPELFSRIETEAEEDPDEAALAAPLYRPPPPFEASEAFAPIPEPRDDDLSLEVPPPPEPMDRPAAGPVHPLSTREVIDQARAAARAAGPGDRSGRIQSPSRPGTQAEAHGQARFDRREPAGLFGSGRGGRSHNSTLQTALLVAGGAAFLSVGAAGVVLMEGPVEVPERPAPRMTLPAPKAEPPPAPAPEVLTPESMAPLEAVPVPAGPVAPPAATPAPSATPSAPRATVAQYPQVIAGVEAQRPGALAQLRALAEEGHAPAQAYLGQLYEHGRFGVQQNMTEARRWTARAAGRGDATSMHNLALYLFRGEGGPQDLPEAARWFRQAAGRGVVNSQYNLGLLYQSGSGVARDLPEAYKWFLIAAAGGDAQAKSNAVDLESKLTPQQLGAAERAADAFRPSRPGTPPPAPPRAPG